MDGMEQTVQGLSPQQEKMLVFFSYARQDKTLRDKLEEHLSNLKYRGLITTWHEREITAGEELKQQIDAHLDEAQIILLLISASFMASDYCYGVEMTRALARHGQGAARVIPILLRPVLYTGAPFALLKMLPTNGKPVVTWRNRDSAFVDIALNIEQVVEERKKVAAVNPMVTADLPPSAPGYGKPTAQGSPSQDQPPPTSVQQPFSSPTQMLAPPPPPDRQVVWSRSSHWSALVVLVVLVLGGLIAAYLQLSAPNGSGGGTAQYPVLPVVLGLLVLAAIFIAIRAIYIAARNRRKKETQKRGQEALAREQEEILRREREEARRREQERIYYSNALAAYERALLLNPRDVTALIGKANALLGLGRYIDALEVFQEAIALDSNASTYSRIGDTLTKLRRYEDALEAYEKAVALDPDLPEAYFQMGDAFHYLGKMQEAAQAREKAGRLGYED